MVAAHAAYRYRISPKVNVRFQINVANLLNSDKGIYNTFATYRAGGIPTNPLLQVPGTIRIPDPRKFTFQTTFDF